VGLERGPLSLVSTHAPAALYSPEKVSGTHFCWRLSKPQSLVRLEGLGKLKKKNSFTSSGLEPATFRIVAYCLNHYATAKTDIYMYIYIYICICILYNYCRGTYTCYSNSFTFLFNFYRPPRPCHNVSKLCTPTGKNLD
jgi:hypothetical protein